MAELEKGNSMFNVDFYNVGTGFKKDEDYKRYRYAYVIAKDLETAQAIATKNCADEEVVIGIRENMNSVVYL